MENIGSHIKRRRLTKKMTQEQLAERLHVTRQAVSKWERGLGYPDISLLESLASFLDINIEEILGHGTMPNPFSGGNMKNTAYFVCPLCGSLTCCNGGAAVSCCGHKLDALVPQPADGAHTLTVEALEDQWYVHSDHPMQKENYISFIALASGGILHIAKQYPQWDCQAYIPHLRHARLLWYVSVEHALYYQLLE